MLQLKMPGRLILENDVTHTVSSGPLWVLLWSGLFVTIMLIK